MGSAVGAIRAAARRLGLPEEVYRERTAHEKWCTVCKQWRHRAEFARDRSRGDGLKAVCRAHGQRIIPGPSRAERQSAAGRGEAWCRDCRAWLPAAAVRSGLCRPHINEHARIRYRLTEGRGRKGRRDKRGVPIVGAETRARLFDVTGGLCGYGCGRVATSLDHVIPVAKGGRTGPGLMVPACTSCNSAKRDRDPWPWIDRLMPEGFSLVEPGLLYDGAILDLIDD